MANVTALRSAESPYREAMLRVLDEARAEVESGKIIQLIMIPIGTNMEFSVWSSGDLTMAYIAGILGRAQLDALEAMHK